MKIIKPLRVSMLTRPFARDQRHWLSMTAIAMADGFGADAKLVPEPEVWKTLAAELGPDAALDAGMPKAGPEFLVSGHAYTRHQQDKTQCAVSVQVHGRRKTLHVSGDRFWVDARPSAPQPFDAMPVDWRHAFGGPGHAENAVGIGSADELVNGLRTRRLPNIELPAQRLHRPDEVRAPAGFGPLDEVRASRAARLGRQYDEHWKQNLFPGYARDMDWRYFNVAPEDQWLAPDDGGLAGAPFEILNMHPQRAVQSGRLPEWRARGFVVRGAHHPRPLDGAELEDFALTLSTAWFFPHLERVALIFHGVTPIAEDDAADISHAMVAFEDAAAPPLPLAGYRETLVTRCESEDRALYFMRDEQLLPECIIGPWPDLDEAMPPPSPLQRNMRARAQALSAELDAKARADGVDTAPYEQAVPPATPVPSLRELPGFIAKTRQSIAEQRRKLDEVREEMDRAAKANAPASRKAGFDTSTFVADAGTTKPKGPPRFDMWPQIERMASDARAGGASPMTPEARAQMKRLVEGAGEKLVQNYRRTAQYQDAADPMAAQDARQARERVAAVLAGSRDFSGMDLTGADLSGLDLRGTRWHASLLEHADLTDSRLDGADMAEALLVRARLVRTSLQGANLAGANMALAQAESADFRHARFDGTALDQLQARGCDFSRRPHGQPGAEPGAARGLRLRGGAALRGRLRRRHRAARRALRPRAPAQGLVDRLRRARPELRGRAARHLRLDRHAPRGRHRFLRRAPRQHLLRRRSRAAQGVLSRRAAGRLQPARRAARRGRFHPGQAGEQRLFQRLDARRGAAPRRRDELHVRAHRPHGGLARGHQPDRREPRQGRARLGRLPARQPVPGRPGPVPDRRHDPLRRGLHRAGQDGAAAQDRSGRTRRKHRKHRRAARMTPSRLEAMVKGGEEIRERSMRGLDLRGLDLSGGLFAQSDFTGADFTGANLEGSVFDDCRLGGASLAAARLADCVFNACDATGARMDDAVLHGLMVHRSDLSGASLRRVDAGVASFDHCTLAGASFCGALSESLVFYGCTLERTDFTGTSLPKATFYQTDLRTAVFAGCDFQQAIFTECDLSGQVLRGLRFESCQFTDANLERCDFEEASLVRCNFKGARMEGASLRRVQAPQCLFPFVQFAGAACAAGVFTQSIWIDAQLEKADFSSADLEQCIFHRARCGEARFAEARLTYADFSCADLHGADFRGATLMRTKVHRAQLEGTRIPERGGLLENEPDLFAAEEFSARRRFDPLTTTNRGSS
jgi:uncharacterized protein YjbI with pentapeptide repeats